MHYINFIIVELKATCWKSDSSVSDREIIKISAIALDGKSLEPFSEFKLFVRPTENPMLSEFCQQLTHIRQGQVDSALPFPEAFSSFMDWIGADAFKLCSWGNFDYELIGFECKRHGTSLPENFCGHLNLKELYARAYSVKPSIGLREAMRKLGMQFEGRHHRGIDDARNIMRVAQTILILDKDSPDPIDACNALKLP